MSSALASLMRLASIAICLVAIASFTLFVVNQSSSASAHQQNEVKSESAAGPHKEGSLHKSIDNVSNAVTSPFSGITAGWSSQWLIRGVNLLLVLVIYGFGLGFLARLIRVKP